MLNPEQEANLKMEIARMAIANGIPIQKIVEAVIPLSEWILGSIHPQPSSPGDKA